MLKNNKGIIEGELCVSLLINIFPPNIFTGKNLPCRSAFPNKALCHSRWTLYAMRNLSAGKLSLASQKKMDF